MVNLVLRLWERLSRFQWYNTNYISNDSPVIIGGCARSGTTLMRVMLDTHPNIFCGPETSLMYRKTLPYRKIIRISKELGLTESDVNGLINNSGSYFEFVEMYFTHLQNLDGKKRWGEKSPVNVRHLDRIFKHFPNAFFIHMIRDGRDTVSSLRTFPKYRIVDGERVETNIINPIEDCIDRWVSDVSKGMEWRGDPRYIEVKYEDLIDESEKTLQTLFNFIGEPWDVSVSKYYDIDKSSRNEAQNPGVSKPIYKSAHGRWKQDFTPEDVELFKSKANDLMVMLGYVTDANW